MIRIWRVGAAPLAIGLAAGTLAAQEPPRSQPAHVLVLGTFHFANPGLDIVKTEVADVLVPAKQAEIAAVTEALARFNPTRIAVEQTPDIASLLDSLYRSYAAGRHQLSRNETEQLGFRLAHRFGHERVYPIDHSGEFPFGPVMQYAQQHNPEFVAFVQADIAARTVEHNRQQREHTIGEILRLHNHPDTLAAGHGLYVRVGSVGAGDGYAGADLLAKWYDRNIRMFANIQRIAAPGERLIVIVGSSHAPVLRDLVTADPTMRLVDPMGYLPER